jgi:hypothetical protein
MRTNKIRGQGTGHLKLDLRRIINYTILQIITCVNVLKWIPMDNAFCTSGAIGVKKVDCRLVWLNLMISSVSAIFQQYLATDV